MGARRAGADRDRADMSVSAFDRVAQAGIRAPHWLAAFALGLLLAAVWMIVHATGGTQRAFTHLFYIPVILSVLRFRWAGAAVTSLAATIVCGPLMPLNSVTGETQQATSWLFRGVMFLAIGSLAYLAIALHRQLTVNRFALEVRDALTRSGQPGAEVDPELVPLMADVLDHRRFHPVFQPVYSLADGGLVAVEALTRFDGEPYRTPDKWFAAAAAAGVGDELEVAAIEAAIEASAGLPLQISLSVNASPTTLGNPHLLELLAAAPRQMVVEITEHSVIEDYHLLQGTVDALRALGVRIAVDDAGAGISSLRHIVQLSPEVIKLDISLTQGVGTSALRRALAGALIDFAQRTDAQLIVEGIEEVTDLTTWAALGADAVQGYLVGRPGNLPVAPHSALVSSLRGGARV